MYPAQAASWTDSSNCGTQDGADVAQSGDRCDAAARSPLPPPSTESVTCNVGREAPGPWRPRAEAAHLSRAPNGIYYFRIVVPEHVRALRPDLPREIRRSTKTSAKQPALRHARQICEELVTSLTTSNATMLVPTTSADRPASQGFLIEYVDGALRTELYAGANAETLNLFARVLPLLTQQVTLGAGALPPLPTPQGSGPTATRHEPQPYAVGSDADPRATSDDTPTPGEPPALDAQGSADAPAQHDPLSPIPAPVWLSEAIERWRTKAGVKFSNQSWKDAYKPTFRGFREMLGTVRRNIVDSDGCTLKCQLDIRLADLTRGHMELFHDLLQQFPSRQGKRNDGLEAPAILKRAAAERAKPQSDVNTAKKMRQVWPFINYAAKKGWVALELAHEFSLQLQAAENRAAERENVGQKKGAIALSIEELCGTYESEAYLAAAVEIDWKYWIDPLRLYTGARVSEISQLHTNDIIEVNGIPCISFINDSVDEEDENEDGGAVSKAETIEEFRRLKNRASRRIIPIHPALIEMGFLEWVKKRQERVGREPGLLFFGLTWEPKSGYGRKASRHTLNLLKAAGVWRKRTKVGHSLRSNCAQELQRVGMPLEMVQRYIGHTTGKQLETRYGGSDAGPAYPLELALEYLKKTNFGVKFPTYAEIHQKQIEHARAKQLARKNGVGAKSLQAAG
jgi:hypothetical protein